MMCAVSSVTAFPFGLALPEWRAKVVLPKAWSLHFLLSQVQCYIFLPPLVDPACNRLNTSYDMILQCSTVTARINIELAFTAPPPTCR